MNYSEITSRIKQSVNSIDSKARVILFGSRARGDYEDSSDWDFLVLTSHQVDDQIKKRIREKLLDAELEAGEVISSLIFSQDKWLNYQITPLYQNIAKEGIEL